MQLAGGDLVGRLGRDPPTQPRGDLGALAANRASARWRSGATVTSPRLRSIAVTTAAPT
ncbi:hypothetical protein I551_4959 [Mycobacterium ulcerans str. Harvey]|uniref:Uncharacterized protein n=1 Tax=Mycobacterium ulcerans str. Harvey TaxID=1299332 RepID=A0ABN0QV20_MYCUL|nr:hypothetical protein I551_4959 [Mycobacterium ulcerans str. Harvey]